MAVATDT